MKSLIAEHLGSGREAKSWPKPTLPEYAFIGRSNVGKSSLINMLCNINKLARVSNTPGRTRNVEHFRVEGTLKSKAPWMLADLPGYGFAKVSQTEREVWHKMIERYLRERENLQTVFLLIDSRLEPRPNDLDMVDWLGKNSVPFVIIFTKSDKISSPKAESNVALFRREMKKTWQNLPTMFITSAETAKGRDEVLEYIEKVNAVWGH